MVDGFNNVVKKCERQTFHLLFLLIGFIAFSVTIVLSLNNDQKTVEKIIEKGNVKS